MTFGLVLAAALATLFLVLPGRSFALDNLAPDQIHEYGGAAANYTVSSTTDVKNATHLSVPVYAQSQPGGTVHIQVNCHDGTASPKVGSNTICPFNGSTDIINIPGSAFSCGQKSVPWVCVYTINFDLKTSGYLDFRLVAPSNMLIGYSASNTPSFAIANINRCDKGKDSSGCDVYKNYYLPFGLACDQGNSSKNITLYDADNTASGDKYNIQPSYFTVKIVDLGTDPMNPTNVTILTADPDSDPGNWGTNQYKTFSFNYKKGHKYALHLDHVYSNNVIQFQLPGDSIWSKVKCGAAGGFQKAACVNPTHFNITAQWSNPYYTPETTANGRLVGSDNKQYGATDGTSPGAWNNISVPDAAWPMKLQVQIPTSPYWDTVDTQPKPTGPLCNIKPMEVSGNCPLDPIINASQLVKVTLPDSTPQPQTAPTYSSSPGTIYKQYVESHKTKVTRVDDKPVAPAIPVSVTIGHKADDYETTTLDYGPYVSGYPYDKNQAAVTYDSYYKINTYRSVNTPSCPWGGSLVGGSCRVSNYPGVNDDPTTTCDKKGNCVTTHHYYCAGGGSVSNGCLYYTYYNPVYAYVLQNTSTEQKISNTVDAYQMKACHYRNFKVNSGATVTVGLDYLEDPSYAQASAKGSVEFSVKYGGALRTPYRLNNIGYDYAYFQACTDAGSGLYSPTGNYGAPTETDSWSIDDTPQCTNMTPKPAIVGTQGCATYTTDPSAGRIDATGAIIDYDFSQGPAIGTGCSDKVINEPYFKVFGGDVSAGNGFQNGAACSPNSNAVIHAWNRGAASSAYNYGAGTDLAAMSYKDIQQFASTQGVNQIMNAKATPLGLAFANTTSDGDYGGSLGGAACAPDYANRLAPGTPVGAVTSVTGLDGAYHSSGPISSLSGQIAAGRHVTLYATGDVFITNGGITYAGIGPNTPVTNIPSFMLVVKGGNIYIDPSVTHLDGSFIAQGGTIYDCATHNGDKLGVGNPNAIFSTCSQKLTVNGSFVANDIKFFRNGTNGSLRFSLFDTGAASNNASEQFNYSPLLWMPNLPSKDQIKPYDSITSLPPVL